MFAKVNRIVFTQQGNKFGVCDGDGNTALWQVNIFAAIKVNSYLDHLQASSTAVPFFTMQTHGKNTADFVFQVFEPRDLKVFLLYSPLTSQGGSSSLLATAGHSADGRNVALWDTLLPQRKACVTAFK